MMTRKICRANQREKEVRSPSLAGDFVLEQGSNWKPSSFVEKSLSKSIRFDDDVERNKKIIEI